MMRGVWTRALLALATALGVVFLGGLTPRVARGQHGLQVASAPTMADCMVAIRRPCLNPGQVRAAYGVDALLRRGITGQGRTIAIVVSFGSPTIRADLRAFDRAFGLPDPQLTVLAPLGMGRSGDAGWAGETTLDVEWAHAIAPGARLVVLVSPVDETEGVQGMPQFLALERYALRHHLVDVFSQSWAATEDTLLDRAGRSIVAQFHQFYVQAAAQGVTAVGASGDEGAGGPNLSISQMFPYPVTQYPASDPLVLAVGGTYLSVDARGQVHDEIAWKDSGGGLSKLFAEPSYQRALAATTQHLLAGRRGVPDVSYNGGMESPVLIYEGGHWTVTSGTSAGTPQWAGLIALADNLAGHDLGSVNGALYHLAASPRYGAVLRDIRSGSTVGPLHGGKDLGGVIYRAGPGWDATTGLGSPRATALIPDLVQSAR